MINERMTTAVFTLFVASGLCLTFSMCAVLCAVKTLEKARHLLYFAWDLLHSAEQEDYRREGTE